MNPIQYLMSLDLTLSDWLLILSTIPAMWFVVVYVFLTKWWPDPLGWIVAIYAVAVAGLLGLIIYAIFAQQRADEWIRTLFALFLFMGLMGKDVILHVERRNGRIQKRRLERHGEGHAPETKETIMTKTAADLAVPDIWYKAQRAIRTGVQTLLAALTVWAAFSLIWPEVMAQLATILPASWVAWLAGAVAAVSAVALALSRIFAIPAVNAFLTKWLNLGSVPKSALIEAKTVEDGKVVEITTVAPDPKAITP